MISILIRNKNEANALANALMSVKKQKFDLPYEVVVIDDASTDNSIEVANEYGCKVVKLDKKFTYGYALNFGLRYCQYEIVLLLSSHNILLSSDFFENLLHYFNDLSVAAVRCTPVSNTNQVLQSIKSNLVINKSNYIHEKDWQNLIVANCSVIRKSVAIHIPFNETIKANEEKLWCLEVLENDYNIVSNVSCYFLYNRKKHYTVNTMELTAKYQIDGIPTKSFSLYLLILLKSIPWALKIAFKAWYNTVKSQTHAFLIPYKHTKGIYK